MLTKHGLDIRLGTLRRPEWFGCSFHKIQKRTVVLLKREAATVLLLAYAATETLSLHNVVQVVEKLATGSFRIGSPRGNLF